MNAHPRRISRSFVAALALLGVSSVLSPAHAQDELNCDLVFRMSAGAMYRYGNGTPETKLRGALPPRGPEVPAIATELHEVLDEIYRHPPIAPFPYGIFRSELCLRRRLGMTLPGPYEVVRAKLERCGSVAEDTEVVSCAMSVLQSRDGPAQ